MGLFGRKRNNQEQMTEAIERLRQHAEEAAVGGHPAGIGIAGLRDVMQLALAARASAGPMMAYAMRAQGLVGNGLQAMATVDSVEPMTDVGIPGASQYRLNMTVTPPDGGAPYQASSEQVLVAGQAEGLAPGTEIHVRIDADDRQHVLALVPMPQGASGTTFTAGGMTINVSGGSSRSSVQIFTSGQPMFGQGQQISGQGQPIFGQPSPSAPGALPGGEAIDGAASSGPGDEIAQLESLARLHASGDLSDREFADAKRRLLGS